MKSDQKFWYKWMLNYSFGELLGIGAAAIIGRFLFIQFSDTPSSSTNLTFVILILAGAAEGLIIGYIQWKSLSKLVKHFKPIPWITVTAISTIAGWLMALPPAVVFISFLSKVSLFNSYYSIVFTALVGMAFGALIGVSQFFLIKKFYKNAIIWVLANVVGWTISFIIMYFTLSLFAKDPSFISGLVLIIIACVLSGLVQGVVTGTSLHFSMVAKDGYEPPADSAEVKGNLVRDL